MDISVLEYEEGNSVELHTEVHVYYTQASMFDGLFLILAKEISPEFLAPHPQ